MPRTATAAAVATAIDDEGRGAFAPAAAPTAAPAAAVEPCELELYRAEYDGTSCHSARRAYEVALEHSIEFILNPDDSHGESNCEV